MQGLSLAQMEEESQETVQVVSLTLTLRQTISVILSFAAIIASGYIGIATQIGDIKTEQAATRAEVQLLLKYNHLAAAQVQCDATCVNYKFSQ